MEVNVDDRLTDIVAAGFDAGIRFGETVERDMVTVRVGPDLRTVVVATRITLRSTHDQTHRQTWRRIAA